MKPTIGIAGAGLLGRIMSLRLAGQGHAIDLFDADRASAEQSCTYTGAGMLAPFCELEHAPAEIATLGADSVPRWQHLLKELGLDVYLQSEGSLVVAHTNDRTNLDHLQRKAEKFTEAETGMQVCHTADIRALEPGLEDRFARGLYFPHEGHISNRDLLEKTGDALRASPGVTWLTQTPIRHVQAHQIDFANGQSRSYDWVIDCRGLGAKSDLPELRGVRGELVYVESREVQLNRPVRLMHPRYPLYIVPRPDHRFVIGATQLESEDRGPVSVRSMLELLSAAYAVHPAFGEARIIQCAADARPAFPDNLPRILHGDGLIRINGLFRHGFLLTPVLTQTVSEILTGKIVQQLPDPIVQCVS
jgi:glycine oxidase